MRNPTEGTVMQFEWDCWHISGCLAGWPDKLECMGTCFNLICNIFLRSLHAWLYINNYGLLTLGLAIYIWCIIIKRVQLIGSFPVQLLDSQTLIPYYLVCPFVCLFFWIKGCIHMCVRIRARVRDRIRILNRFNSVLVVCVSTSALALALMLVLAHAPLLSI